MRTAVATVAVAALSLAALAFIPARAQPPAAPKTPLPCTPAGKLNFICGLRAPEDLVKVPGAPWIIASGLANAQQPGSGGLYLIDETAKTAAKLALPATGTARAPYEKCPGPPNPQTFSAHGLNIRAQDPGRAHLFVVGHGGREAIEVFEVASGRGTPAITWIGCITPPAGAYMNSVTTTSDGRVFATNFYNAPKTMQNALMGEDTGWVMQWRPGGQFEKVPGTDLPGPNGIEITPDMRWMFVAVTGSSQVMRYDLNDTWRAGTFINGKLRADNLRWAPDGRLLLAGPGNGPQGAGPTVVALDPGPSLKTEDLLREPPTPAFPGHAAALVSGKTLWLGTYNGDRVAWTTLP